MERIDKRLWQLSQYVDELLIYIRDASVGCGRADLAELADLLRVDIKNEITVSILELQMYHLGRKDAEREVST